MKENESSNPRQPWKDNESVELRQPSRINESVEKNWEEECV